MMAHRWPIPALLGALLLIGCPARGPVAPSASARPKAPRKAAAPTPTPVPTATPAPRPSPSGSPSPSPVPTASPAPTPAPTPAPLAVTTFAGTGPIGVSGGGFAEGAAAAAQFSFPEDVAAGPGGLVYVCDTGNNRIRKITPEGVVSTLAGQAAAGFADGTGAEAKFDFPVAIAVDATGDLYVADSGNNRIRKVTTGGVVTTVAGGMSGFADGGKELATFDRPMGIAIDLDGGLVVSDTYNHRVRKVTLAGSVSTLAGGAAAALANGAGDAARFNRPHDLVVDPQGVIYVADSLNHCIRRLQPGSSGATVSVYAGLGGPNAATTGGELKDGPAGQAKFFRPVALALAADGDLFVADQLNHRLRVVRKQTMQVETVAGADPGAPGGGFRDGPAAEALFAQPFGLCIETSGRLLVADTGNSKIRAATPISP